MFIRDDVAKERYLMRYFENNKERIISNIKNKFKPLDYIVDEVRDIIDDIKDGHEPSFKALKYYNNEVGNYLEKLYEDVNKEINEKKIPPGFYDEKTLSLVLHSKDIPLASLTGNFMIRPEPRIAWGENNKPFVVYYFHDGTPVGIEEATPEDLERYS